MKHSTMKSFLILSGFAILLLAGCASVNDKVAMNDEDMNDKEMSQLPCHQMTNGMWMGCNEIIWATEPPESIVLGEEFSASWQITTGTTVEHTNLHACPPGLAMAECSKETGRIDSEVQGPLDPGALTAQLTLPAEAEAGEWMIMAHAKIDGESYTSEMAMAAASK